MISEADPSPALFTAVQALLTPPDRTVRLSGFQVRAAQRILRAIGTGEELATIVCAGTGSGKTLAFYLPALASIYRHALVADKSEHWVKAVAL
jgi:superfamily II DNA/RNA helicase